MTESEAKVKQKNLVKKSLWLDESTMPGLELIAESESVSVSAVIRWAIKEKVNQFFLTASSDVCTVNQTSEPAAAAPTT